MAKNMNDISGTLTKHTEMAHRKLRLLVYVTQVLVHCMTHMRG